MPSNTGEAREIKRRANANEAEVVRESKTLARKVKAKLTREEEKEWTDLAGRNAEPKKQRR